MESLGGEIIKGFTLNPVVGFNPPITKKKRNLPGTPDPEAEVIALSPKTLMATNRFICDICGKGFQRDQNLQLHRRGHNVPWKLRQRSTKEMKKRVYVCPEKTCVHHQPLRALGDLTGIKKHFCRKHGEKKYICEKCSKRYAVQSDWKAHLKTCGTREYKCDCGTIFSRRDSFLSHRAFCDALAEETARVTATSNIGNAVSTGGINYHSMGLEPITGHHFPSFSKAINAANNPWMDQGKKVSQSNALGSMSLGTLYGDPFASCLNHQQSDYQFDWALGSTLSTAVTRELISTSLPVSDVKDGASAPSLYSNQNHLHRPSQANMSATALLQKAAQIGVTSTSPSVLLSFGMKRDDQTHDRNEYYDSFREKSEITDKSENDTTAMNLWQMYPSKRRNIQTDDTKEAGQTRDFLGVGGVQQALCTSSVNGYI